MTEDDVLDLPPVRSEPEIIAAFLDLADECETRSNPDDVPDRFITAHRLMLEARVPRMPDTDDELRRMLDEALKEPPEKALSLADVEEHIKQHHEAFMGFQTRLHALLQLGAYESAAMLLMPVTGRTGPGYSGSVLDGEPFAYYPFSFDIGLSNEWGQQTPRCVITSPFVGKGKVSASAPLPGLAMLAAICKAHAEWHELWKR